MSEVPEDPIGELIDIVTSSIGEELVKMEVRNLVDSLRILLEVTDQGASGCLGCDSHPWEGEAEHLPVIFIRPIDNPEKRLKAITN